MGCGKESNVTNNGQMSLEEQEIKRETELNEIENEEWYYHIRVELPQTSPIFIPETSSVKEEKKDGYEQIKYKWTQDGYNYESRWHTHTPGAPEYSQNSWVVTRTLPGIPAGKNYRKKELSYLIKNKGWVSSDEWDNAKSLRRAGKETNESRRLLDNGHWKV